MTPGTGSGALAIIEDVRARDIYSLVNSTVLIQEATAPEPLSALHQLPPPPADFTGREADLVELRAAIEAGGATISGVRGMGGIGKTALALKLAEDLVPLYPDAQIYLDLQGVSAKPVSPAQAMAHVIRAFHPNTPLPEGEAERAVLYRSALHGQRALLLMDNAAGADQVSPLIPPEGCLLLVTSRIFFHLPGFQVKDLDEMPLEDARALLLQIAPRIGDQADRIAEVCAGVPFALRQAAGTLTERPDLSPVSYASRLESFKARLGLIEASLSLSYDLLPEELACRWRILSALPASFDVPMAASVWKLEPEPAEAALGELVRRSLVEGKDGYYRLHDLAQVFAESRCSQEERAISAYLEAARLASEIIVGAVIQQSLGRGDLSVTEILEQWLSVARMTGDRRGEASACWTLGLELEKLGDLGRAAEAMQISVNYERERGLQEAEKHAVYVEAIRTRMVKGEAPPDQPDQS